jgi:EAL domain-containing protein (putative c-di-GMP-specific phosphodiesterase class I)
MIVETIAAMARGLGLQVAAEGVETEAQLERLRAVGCEEWQGHLYSEPLEAAAFERLALGMRKAAAG